MLIDHLRYILNIKYQFLGSSGCGGGSWSSRRAISSGTKVTGSRQALCPLLLPTTTDLRWPAGLQAVADLDHLSPHRSYIRTLPPASQLRESFHHLGSRVPEKSDRPRYANITQGKQRGVLSPTGIGLQPGPGLFGRHQCANPARRLFAQPGTLAPILTTEHQRIQAGKVS